MRRSGQGPQVRPHSRDAGTAFFAGWPRTADAQYVQTIVHLGLGEPALEQAFRLMVSNVAGVNCDDHTQNFAFLLPDSGWWQPAPAYDITHAFNPHGDQRKPVTPGAVVRVSAGEGHVVVVVGWRW
jgi:hypothetical protein